MDKNEYLIAWEVYNYAKCIASQISGVPFENVSPDESDFVLAVQFHALVERTI